MTPELVQQECPDALIVAVGSAPICPPIPGLDGKNVVVVNDYYKQQDRVTNLFRAIPHNSKCRYGERGAADAKPKAQIILDAAKVSAASGGNSEPKQGQRSQSARGFCPRSTMRVPQPDIIEHFGNADAVPQPPERCLSRKAGIVRCCLKIKNPRKAGILGQYLAGRAPHRCVV